MVGLALCRGKTSMFAILLTASSACHAHTQWWMSACFADGWSYALMCCCPVQACAVHPTAIGLWGKVGSCRSCRWPQYDACLAGLSQLLLPPECALSSHIAFTHHRVLLEQDTRTPLFIAAQFGRSGCVALFLESGAGVNQSLQVGCMWAA